VKLRSRESRRQELTVSDRPLAFTSPVTRLMFAPLVRLAKLTGGSEGCSTVCGRMTPLGRRFGGGIGMTRDVLESERSSVEVLDAGMGGFGFPPSMLPRLDPRLSPACTAGGLYAAGAGVSGPRAMSISAGTVCRFTSLVTWRTRPAFCVFFQYGEFLGSFPLLGWCEARVSRDSRVMA